MCECIVLFQVHRAALEKAQILSAWLVLYWPNCIFKVANIKLLLTIKVFTKSLTDHKTRLLLIVSFIGSRGLRNMQVNFKSFFLFSRGFVPQVFIMIRLKIAAEGLLEVEM